MFTGIIEELGAVKSIEMVRTEWAGRVASGIAGDDASDNASDNASEVTIARLVISARKVLEGSFLGASISVNGCCLTLVDRGNDRDGDWWATEMSSETLQRTALGSLRPGDRVNLERPLALGDRLGGHLVLGHVDCTGEVVAPAPDLVVRLPLAQMCYVVEKGSIAVDGISLTAFDLTSDTFRVAVIPHTADVTTLGAARPGAVVNIELDILAKHVERLLEPYRP
ncbi:MAG: riboflavin synthase [Ilumatobacteraceae bacterium]